MKTDFFNKIHENPIIAAVGNIEKLDDAINSSCEIIFLLTGDILNVEDVVKRVKAEGKSIYIHMDLLDGLARDAAAIRYISEKVKPDGIITTKSNLIRHAKRMNLFTIQRLFMLDSLSLKTGIKSIKETRPDAVEVMPGIIPKISKRIYEETRIPIIAGGLIMDKEDVIGNLKAGVIGISTSKMEIWKM